MTREAPRRHPGRPPHPDVLTPAEWRVLEEVRSGRTNQEIAERLGISHHTVKTHISSMLAKLEMRHRHELAAWRGEPIEASRSAIRRLRLAAPLLWLRDVMAGSALGKGAAGVVVVSVVAGGVLVLNSAFEHASKEVGAGDTPTVPAPTASATPIAEETAPAALEQEPFPWRQPPGLPVRLAWDEVADDSAQWSEAIVTIDPGSGAWNSRSPGGLVEIGSEVRDRYWIVDDPDAPGERAVLDTETGETTGIGPGWTGVVSSDGQWVALIPEPDGSTLVVVEVETGERHDLGELGKPVHLAWSSIGTLSIVHGLGPTGLSNLRIASAPDWEPTTIIEIPYHGPVWAPDGARIAFVSSDYRFAVGTVNEATGSIDRVQMLAQPEEFPLGIAWSPEGSRVMITGRLGTGREGASISILHVEDATNVLTPIVSLRDPDLVMLGPSDPPPAFSPDGSRFAVRVVERERDEASVIVVAADGSSAYRLVTGGLGDYVGRVLGWDDDGVILGGSNGP